MEIQGGQSISMPMSMSMPNITDKSNDKIILSNFIKTLSETECKNGKEGNCFKESTLDKMLLIHDDDIDLKQFISPMKKLEKVMEITNCKTQRCVAESDLAEEKLPHPDAQGMKDVLKAEGPRNTTEWLNNFHINNKLKEVSEYDNLEYLDTTMNDFAEQNHKLSNTAYIKEELSKNKAIACVINTDTYASCNYGGTCGQHWVCVLLDGRKPIISLEYFDSVGKPPSSEVSLALHNIKNSITDRETKMVINKVSHQQRNTECGVYCLFYIMSRFEEVPYSSFHDPNNRLRDEQMITLRRSLFTAK